MRLSHECTMQAAPPADGAAPAPEKKAEAPKAADAPADAPKPKKKKSAAPAEGSTSAVSFLFCQVLLDGASLGIVVTSHSFVYVFAFTGGGS